MGKIKQGILGGFSGKVANVVGSSWKGIAVMKSLPLSVANPRTAAQVAQRSDFSDTIKLGSELLSDWVKPLWDRWASQMSGFNAFAAMNIEKVSQVADKTYENFVMSSGKMAEVPPAAPDFIMGFNSVSIGFDPDAGGALALPTDVVYGIAFGNDLSKILKANAPFIRSDGEIVLNSPTPFVLGDEYFYTVAFIRTDGTIVSDSVIHSSVVIAG